MWLSFTRRRIRARSTRRRRSQGRSPGLEALEARQLLAVFAVDTFDDVIADDGLVSLREAIQEANTTAGNDTINLPAGTYNLTISGADEDAAATGDLDVDDATGVTSIEGEGAATTIINASGLSDRVFDVRPGASLGIGGVTVTGGSAADGAGILNAGSLDIANSSITSNSASNLGGGIYNNGASATAAIDSSTISGNAAVFGGGVYNSDGQLTVSSSTINGNNAGTDGGGIYNTNGAASLENTTVSNNTATNDGGGVHNSNNGTGVTTLINSTIATNAAGGDGGGVWGGTNPVVVVNTLIATNTADATGPDVHGGFTSNGNNLIGNASGSSSFVNEVNGDLVGFAIAPIDPRLGPLQDNGGLTHTHALLFDSPAIDMADNAAAAQDQRGVSRPQAATADIGAVELNTILVDSATDVIDAGDGVTTLREAVIAANESSTEDRIILPEQLFTLTLTGADEDAAATGDLDITSGPVMLVGVGINRTFVNAAGLDRVFDVFDADVTFQKMTITGGSASGADAAGSGGGIRAADGAIVLDEVNLVGNGASQNGAGIYKSGTGSVQVAASIITSNVADNNGGGFYNLTGDFDVRGTTISGNQADVDGGGFYNGVSGTTSIHESTLSNNAAGGDGGGLAAENAVSITNSTLSGNGAEASGGAASVVGTLDLEHVTVADNQADGGGGVFVDTGGSLSLTNTIVATNSGTTSGPDILNSGTVASSGGNLIGNDADLVFTPQGSDQVGTSATPLDPRLLPLADNGGPTETHALMEDSSAIDAAADSTLATDQRGVPRRIGAASDIGSVEITTAVTDVAASTDEETPITIDLIQQDPDPRIISANLSTDVGGVWTVDQTGAAPYANVTSSDVSVADAQIELNGTPIPFDSGITLATVRQNFSGAAADHRTVGAYEDGNGDTRVNTTELQSDNTPAIANLAVASFPFQRGWTGGHVDADGTLLSGGGIDASDITQTGTGRYQITVPGVEDSYNDGVLFAIAGGDTDNVTAATPLGGDLWEVANRDNADDLEQGEDGRFSFLYIPWSTPGLIAGQVLGTGSRGFGDFSVTPEAAGEWRLSVADQTPETGMLILTVADDNFLSYQADADDFMIHSHDLPAATLEDSDFGFVFVPFDATDFSVAEINTGDTLGQVTDEGDGTVTYDPSGCARFVARGNPAARCVHLCLGGRVRSAARSDRDRRRDGSERCARGGGR